MHPTTPENPSFTPSNFRHLQTVNDSFSVLIVQKYLTYVRQTGNRKGCPKRSPLFYLTYVRLKLKKRTVPRPISGSRTAQLYNQPFIFKPPPPARMEGRILCRHITTIKQKTGIAFSTIPTGPEPESRRKSADASARRMHRNGNGTFCSGRQHNQTCRFLRSLSCI